MPISPKMYDSMTQRERAVMRGLYLRAQGGNCWYCDRSLWLEPHRDKPVDERLFPPRFFDHALHLHHDKRTGMTLGAVHAYCNAVSFQYDELPRLRHACI